MRSLQQFLPLCAAAALAHGHTADQEHRAGVCWYRGLSARLSGGGPICLPRSHEDAFLSATEDGSPAQYTLSNRTCGNGTLCGTRNVHNWTYSTPCAKGSSSNYTMCVFSDSAFAEGRGISFVATVDRANFVASLPAFRDPEITLGINQDLVRTKPAQYEVREFPGKGKGLVASQHIRRGDLIMANTASLMIDYRSFEELATAEYRTLQAAAIEHLPKPHKEAVMQLSTHVDAKDLTAMEIIDRVTSTNGFDIEPHVEDEEQEHGFFALFPEISRMNHDCRPNADYYFDYDTMTQYIHAVRDISAGEELTLSYINPVMSRRDRIRRLKQTWGFDCACRLCTQDRPRTGASDSRINQIDALVKELRSYKPESQATPEMAELLISLYQQENLWGMMYEAYTYAALEYNGAGQPWTAIKYARLAIEHGIPAIGENHDDVIAMETVAEDPSQHWSWMHRTKKRMGFGKKPKARSSKAHEA